MRTKHAALTDKGVYVIDHAARRLRLIDDNPSPSHISGIHALANLYDLTHVWVFPGCEYDRAGYDALSDREGYNIFFTTLKGGTHYTHPQAARCRVEDSRQAGAGHEVNVFYPSGQNSNFQWTVTTPTDILAAVDYLERELGIDCAWSPAHMAQKLYLHMHTLARHETWLRSSEIDLETLPFQASCRDIQWRKPFDRSMIGLYLHQ